jgi:hypothetical protein
MKTSKPYGIAMNPSHWIETAGELWGIPPGRRVAHEVQIKRAYAYFELPRGRRHKAKVRQWQRMDRGPIQRKE